MDERERAEWIAYDRLDPIGQQRGDLNAAIIAHTVASVFCGKGRQPRVSDFMPDWDTAASGDAGQQSIESMKAVFMAAATAANQRNEAKYRRKRKRDK